MKDLIKKTMIQKTKGCLGTRFFTSLNRAITPLLDKLIFSNRPYPKPIQKLIHHQIF